MPRKARGGRTLRGEKSRRIVEAMRDSVAEVGIADSTFDRVAAKAGVSRGLLHYYFGTKEQLLVEVIRRDTQYRIDMLGGALRAAKTIDEVIAAFALTFSRTLTEQQGYVYMVSELFIASRNNEEIRDELGELYGRARREFAEILRDKESAGVVKLRYDAESVLATLFATGDGSCVQYLCDPTLNREGFGETSLALARFLLDAEA